MAHYVISDIHGEYDMLMDLLDKINFSDDDTLYILGDVVDRGPNPVKTLLWLMTKPNIIPIYGNHEQMAEYCLEMLSDELTEEDELHLSRDLSEYLVGWELNGGWSTISEYYSLPIAVREEVMDYISDFALYKEVEVEGKKYLLVHGGLGNFSPERDLEEYSIEELVWCRPDYDTRYFEDTFVVTGHTPTQTIADNPNPGRIYRKNNHIAIDCGAFLYQGQLAALCLETNEEFYSEPNDQEVDGED